MNKISFDVTGMSCAACSARIEKAVGSIKGVEKCEVSLLTDSMTVTGDAAADDIINAVKSAGYGANVKGKKSAEPKDSLRDTATPALFKRLCFSLIFLLVLMYISMGHAMWGWPLPKALEENYMAQGILQMLLCGCVAVINQQFFISGTKAVIHRAPNMDTLVSLGAAASFVYSTYALFAMAGAYAEGNGMAAEHYLHEMYFESCAMILALITVGKMLEARSKGKTADAIRSLMELSPATAFVIRGSSEVEIPVEEVTVGDVFAVRPGGRIPVDGTVTQGHSSVDESSLTGESIPVDKAPGSAVYAGCINKSGYIRCKADKVGEDTALSQIIKLVSDAAATKAPISKIADKVSGVFVPTVIAIAGVTVAAWILAGEGIGYALARGISVLVISCPCALGLATPVAIMVGSGVGAHSGILFKSAAALEDTGKIDIVVLDKTGTVTEGRPEITDVIPAMGKSTEELLTVAASLEYSSEHPLSAAVMRYASQNGIEPEKLSGFEALPGKGVTGTVGGTRLFGGKESYAAEIAEIPEDIAKRSSSLYDEGKTLLYFGRDNSLLGIIAMADRIKADSADAVRQLEGMGIKVVMLTGDNERSAFAVGRSTGIDRIIANVLPAKKEEAVFELMKEGRVAMVGDGINDAPALTRAHVGIAIGQGTDIAVDAADVVLMNSGLTDVAAAIRLGRKTLTNIRENLFWAFFYNVIGIPAAAGLFVGIFAWKPDPMFAAAAMSLSSFCVVTNALRLNFAHIHSSKHDKRKHCKKVKEKKTMEIKMNIEGMMCGHCSARVKKCLEAIDGVESAEVSHESGIAVIKLAEKVDIEVLKSAVEAEGYTVIK